MPKPKKEMIESIGAITKPMAESLPTMKDKEMELEKLLSESEDGVKTEADLKKENEAKQEQATYDRLKKQGMSDQGIVSPEQLVEAGKKVYRKVKSKVKSVMGVK
jgi:hypothetical protein